MNIFYCKHCKRIVYTYPGGGTLTCCGEEMTLLQPKSKDLGNEKHLPVVIRTAPDQFNGFLLHRITHIKSKHLNLGLNRQQLLLSNRLKISKFMNSAICMVFG
jgi:desulfoferrodoxin-like iron-binding protein